MHISNFSRLVELTHLTRSCSVGKFPLILRHPFPRLPTSLCSPSATATATATCRHLLPAFQAQGMYNRSPVGCLPSRAAWWGLS